MRYEIASNSDIVPEVLEGEADFALLGSDKFGELGSEVREMLRYETIGTLACRFGLQVLEGRSVSVNERMSVATSYPRALARFAIKTGLAIGCVRKMSGKVERAPASGLTDAAFDIVETGNSVRANGLEVIQVDDWLELGGVWR